MSIDLLLSAPRHPARSASIRSVTSAQNRDRAAWLANWAEDAVLEDPVGPSPMDPDGKGHRGKEAIARFWDNVIAPNEIRFCIRSSYACGNECANVGTITVKLLNGMVSRTELVMVYRVNADGLLESMRAFWEFDQTAKNTF